MQLYNRHTIKKFPHNFDPKKAKFNEVSYHQVGFNDNFYLLLHEDKTNQGEDF